MLEANCNSKRGISLMFFTQKGGGEPNPISAPAAGSRKLFIPQSTSTTAKVATTQISTSHTTSESSPGLAPCPHCLSSPPEPCDAARLCSGRRGHREGTALAADDGDQGVPRRCGTRSACTSKTRLEAKKKWGDAKHCVVSSFGGML